MKNLRKVAGITIFFILIFMVIALFQYQSKEEMSLLQDRIEYYFNEDWTVVSVDADQAAGELAQNYVGIPQEVEKAVSIEGKYQKVDLPYTGKSNASDIIVFMNMLPQEWAGLTMDFSSAYANVYVFLDNEIIYQYHPEESHATETNSKSHEHFINLPNVIQDGELLIMLTSPYPDAAALLGDVKIETRDMVVIGVMGNNIADIGCCLLIIIAAIIMFVLAMIRLYTNQPSRSEIFLGLAGLAAGIYCFIGTDTLNIFYNIQKAYEMQEYLVLLLPLFLTLYFERNLHTRYPHRFSILLFCVSVHAAVQIFLQISGICNLKDMINISAAAVGIVCLTAIVTLIQYDYKTKRYQTLLSVLSMLILLSGGIANVIMNTVFRNPMGNTAGQYSMTVFSIMMAVMHVLQLSKEYRANAEEKAKAAQQQNMQLIQAKKDADAARHEAMAANEAKGKFLAHMSHEIRTPINAVLGMDEMILRETREDNIKEYAMDIYMAGQTLLSLINDILDFSKIDSGKMEIVPVEYDTSSLIHDLSTMASQRAKDKNIGFEVEIDHTIPSRLYGDDVRIRQVLTNILTNAVKYTHEGTVWLRIQSKQAEENVWLSFEVEDTGIGIKQEDLPKLSAEFERIEEDRNRHIEGTGLGMNITIQLLALLGSKLQVESVYGKGSKFYFTLEQKIIDHTPIGDFESRVQQIAENYSYSTKLYAPDAQLLVVDDNAVNRKVLRNLLKETQIQITDAESGIECLNLVQENRYDLIFLDHMMPGMDGVETLHRIKALSGCPCQNTPIVVLTANAVSGAREKYLSEGFDDFLSKPIVPEKLENMIKHMLPAKLQQTNPKLQNPIPEAADNKQETAPPEESLENLPFVDGLDWHYAWLHLPDMELLEYTVKEFYAQIHSAADRLEQAYHQISEPAQLEQYRIQVHAMKSLAATIGIIPLSGIAKILEYAAKDGKIDVIDSLTSPLLEEWRSYSQKLEGVFGIEAPAEKKTADFSIIQALLEMINTSMEEMDIDQADQSVRQLQAYEYPEEIRQNIQKLAEAVTNLDLEETGLLTGLLTGQMKEWAAT